MNRDNVRLIERAAMLQSAHVAETLAALFAEYAIFEDVPFEVVGDSEMEDFWTNTLRTLPDFSVTLTSVFA